MNHALQSAIGHHAGTSAAAQQRANHPARAKFAPVSWIGLAIMLLWVTPSALAQSKKPRVPPGLDPGGVAVAIADPVGIHYADPQIAQRLARDGEGELIGWDFVDEDRRPFAEPGTKIAATSVAGVLLREAGAARLLAVEPKLEGAALKARILALAKPLPAPHSTATRHGWIAD